MRIGLYDSGVDATSTAVRDSGTLRDLHRLAVQVLDDVRTERPGGSQDGLRVWCLSRINTGEGAIDPFGADLTLEIVVAPIEEMFHDQPPQHDGRSRPRSPAWPTTATPAQRDDDLRVAIRSVWDAHLKVYGPQGVEAAPARRHDGRALHRPAPNTRDGTRRRRARARLDHDDGAAHCCGAAARLVERALVAQRPNQLWVSDFTYVATWHGFVYVAFVIDVFARRLVGWRVSASLKTDFLPDTLEQAIHAQCGTTRPGLVHHSARDTQYPSMRYTDR